MEIEFKKEGKDKPYLLREKGPYIRINEADVVMNRLQLDKIYSSKKQDTSTIREGFA